VGDSVEQNQEENKAPEVVEREPHNVDDMKRKLNLSNLKRV